jgi:REP element-mobilizing transposase RayT
MPIRTLIRRSRTSPRLRGFDYSTRKWYFVTINAKRHQPLFGTLGSNGVMLSEVGSIVAAEWERTADLRRDVSLDEFIVMPDHFHALVGLNPNDRDRCDTTLTAMMNGFKAAATSRVRRLPSPPAFEIWHRSFHDSIIRGQRHFDRVRRYIEANPSVGWHSRRLPGSRVHPR